MKTMLLILTALFAALTAAGAFIKIPFLCSAITLQFFFTALAGVLLGAKYGALSQFVYVALGLVGLPIFTAGGGFGYLLYPTCGFLIGPIPSAWVIGKLTGGSRSIKRIVPACLACLAVLYLVGLPYMAGRAERLHEQGSEHVGHPDDRHDPLSPRPHGEDHRGGHPRPQAAAPRKDAGRAGGRLSRAAAQKQERSRHP